MLYLFFSKEKNQFSEDVVFQYTKLLKESQAWSENCRGAGSFPLFCQASGFLSLLVPKYLYQCGLKGLISTSKGILVPCFY